MSSFVLSADITLEDATASVSIFNSGYSKPFRRFPKVIITSPSSIELTSSLYTLSISLSLRVLTNLSPLGLVPDNIIVLYPFDFLSFMSSINKSNCP